MAGGHRHPPASIPNGDDVRRRGQAYVPADERPPVGAPTYCPDCGTRLVERRVEGRDRRYCSFCDRPVYRNPKPCAGVVVVRGEEVLLIRRTAPPNAGTWSLPAGYLEHDEPPATGAVRELREETGLRVEAGAVDLLGTRLVDRGDGTHVVVLVYATERGRTGGDPVAGDDAGAVRFWSPASLAAAEARPEPGYLPLFERAVERYR